MPEQIFPEPTIGVFICNQASELLLLKSHKWPGKYVIPCGHVEVGERLEAAAIREAKGETVLDIYDLKFICFQEFIYDPSFWKKRHFIFCEYACRTDSLDVELNDEAEGHARVKLEAALHLPLHAYSRYSIDRLIEGISL